MFCNFKTQAQYNVEKGRNHTLRPPKIKNVFLHENRIIDSIINIAIDKELKNDNIAAFYVMDDAFVNVYKSLQNTRNKKELVYFYAYYLAIVHENGKAIDLLIKKNINSSNVYLDDLKSVILLSKLYINQGDYVNAINWCDKGLSLINYDNKHKNYMGLMTNKINSFVALKNHKSVLSNSFQLRSLINSNPQYATHYYTNIGTSYLNEKKYADARYYFNKSQLYDSDINTIIVGQNNIATTYQEEKKYNKSIKLFDDIIRNLNKIYPDLKTKEVSKIYRNQAKNYYFKQDLINANKSITKSLHLLNYKNSVKYFRGSNVSLLESLTDKAKFNIFQKGYGKYLNFQIDSLIDLMRQEHTEQGSKLFWREKTHEFYENALETCYRLGDTKNAFYFMEKSRAILLLDALKDLDAKEILTPTQRSEEQKLRYAATGLQNKLELLQEHDKNYATTFQQLFEAKEKYQKFIKSLEQSNPAYYRLKYDNQYVSLENWQKHLSQNQQSAIQYFVGDSAVYALAITAQKTTFKKINLTNYKQLALTFNRLAAQSPPHTKAYFEEFKQTSHQLYQLIFAPFDLPKGRLVVSPDGYFIPFNALVSNPKTNQYLLHDYAFSYAYSANILLKNEQSNWSFSHNLLAIAPVRFQKSLRVPSLVQSDVFAENIEGQYFSGKILTNTAATKQNFIDNAPKYNLIQLFTHGKADSTEAGSKIYFQDKILTLKELYSMSQLKADLVILSACQTNLGKIATGEGVMSLARGFAYLGVPSTVSTLWSVNDKSTYQITTSFYKYLDDGLAKDMALQKAQQDYLSQESNVVPYFWSSMVLVGNVEELPKHHYLYLFLIIFAGLLTFFIAKTNKRKTIA